MTTHLSARLAWHDRGWDGRVCDEPHLNAHCIVHQHIRDCRDDDKERKSAGTALADLGGWLPPCSRDPAAYADRGFVLVHRDPLEFRGLPPVSEDLPPYSSCPAPYRWMREEFFREVCEAEDLTIRGPDDAGKSSGWVYEPDRQRELLQKFWGKLESARSLVFYYCNHGNPLDENASRIVVGVGRVAEVGPQLYFGTSPNYQDEYPVWSRRITQAYPDQGVRIPYQEYLRAGHSTDDIICRVPRNAMLPFSYGGEHVSDDIAVAILERVIQSVKKVAADGYIVGDWEERLAWLNDVLAEVWHGRGPFPGAGSVLQYLGCSSGTSFQRTMLAPMMKEANKNPWDYVTSILEGTTMGPKHYRAELVKASERWNILKSRQALLSKLACFELTPDQIRRIADPRLRSASGISATEDELVANAYVISESDLGAADSNSVSLETIDHGLRPEGNAALFSDNDGLVSHDDRRRVRAVGVEVLRDAAGRGDTLLTLPDFLRLIHERFPQRRACQPDQDVVVAEANFYQHILWTAFDSDPMLVALKHIHSLEQHAASIIKRRTKKTNSAAEPPVMWQRALKRVFGEPQSERRRRAENEQVKALQTLFRQRLSVLTGGAGTGKTSVLKVFLQELIRAEGHHPTLLLAPTGKARVRLSTKTEHNAMTIHQFLLKQGWFVPDIFVLRSESDEIPYQATTVIVDECSMIPIDLFGTLLRALDTGPLRRLILVGDPSQLPPIGPGRPFADIIEWLRQEHADCIAHLGVELRTDEEDENETAENPRRDSVALALAAGYQALGASPGDDEILAAVAQGEISGDLEVVFWNDHDELLDKLRRRMGANLDLRDDYQSFNASLGIDTKDWSRSENWQILSPTRAHHFGTEDLNRLIQREYKGGLITSARTRKNVPRPFGDQEIVWTDKVIQLVNRSLRGWPRDTGLDYVANGEIGIVRNTKKDSLDVVFSTQTDVSYRYFRQQVGDNLDLAYALTVHKAQGSDFNIVFLIIPQKGSTLSRELIYTGLTRFRHKLVLLIEKNIEPLLRLRSPDSSDTRKRNTYMFTLALRPDDVKRPRPEALIHRTRNGTAVRSKSEVIVADTLDALEISYAYEQPLYSRKDPKDFRLPDFTASFDGDVYYWEHLGMLTVPSYREAWERKRKWYEDNGHADRLVTSEDGPDGSIDATQIERIARERILEQ